MVGGRSRSTVAALAAALLLAFGAVPAVGFGPNEAGGTELAKGPTGAAESVEIEESAAGTEAETVESEEQDTEEQELDVEELERRIDLLAEELERLRSGEPVQEVSID